MTDASKPARPDAARAPCPHEHLGVFVLDQTLGVTCADCGECLAHCWMDRHVSESLWNRAAAQDPTSSLRPCEQDRDDVCGVCGDVIGADRLRERTRS
jgi:hypothetical protein